MVKVFYPGSFDPAHNGHIDVATRASKLFDEVVVGVYKAPPKTLMFDTEERVSLFQEALERGVVLSHSETENFKFDEDGNLLNKLI